MQRQCSRRDAQGAPPEPKGSPPRERSAPSSNTPHTGSCAAQTRPVTCAGSSPGPAPTLVMSHSWLQIFAPKTRSRMSPGFLVSGAVATGYCGPVSAEHGLRKFCATIVPDGCVLLRPEPGLGRARVSSSLEVLHRCLAERIPTSWPTTTSSSCQPVHPWPAFLVPRRTHVLRSEPAAVVIRPFIRADRTTQREVAMLEILAAVAGHPLVLTLPAAAVALAAGAGRFVLQLLPLVSDRVNERAVRLARAKSQQSE